MVICLLRCWNGRDIFAILELKTKLNIHVFIEKKTTVSWSHACRKKVAGLLSHTLRTGQLDREVVYLKMMYSFLKSSFSRNDYFNVSWDVIRAIKIIFKSVFMFLDSVSIWEQDIKNWRRRYKGLSCVFRSHHERLLWDCMGDHQGQLLLPSQEEGWVWSGWCLFCQTVAVVKNFPLYHSMNNRIQEWRSPSQLSRAT